MIPDRIKKAAFGRFFMWKIAVSHSAAFRRGIVPAFPKNARARL